MKNSNRLEADVLQGGLVIELLGAPTWRIGSGRLEPLAPKDAAMLAKLALDGPQPRVKLCDLLWPTSGREQAAASLRQRASRLSAAAGRPFVQLADTVSLAPSVRVDAANLDALDDDVLSRTPGLLPGIDLGDHLELDRWIDKARAQMLERCVQRLTDRAEALERDGRLHEALALARRIVELMPLAEQGWRRVMRLHYLRGDRAAAQDAYWRLHALLRDELGARPSAETQHLFQTVETAENAPALPRRPVPVSLMQPPVLVGRRAPWAAMVNAWATPQPIVLVGDAGMGKTRLLTAFVERREGLLFDRARPGDDEAANALLGRLLVEIDRRFAPDLAPTARAELARMRPEFGTPPKAEANAAVLRHAVEACIAAAITRGLSAIVVDDLHYADESSVEAMRWLAAAPALAKLSLAFGSRPWGGKACGGVLDAWSTDSHRFVRVDLQPLTRPDLTELLASLALPLLVDSVAADRLYRHAGGHPLFTLATLRHALASGSDLRAADALALPESVAALLDARILALPAHARDLLQVAAVGGADLGVERAARVLDRAPLELSQAWAALEADDVLRGEAFSHDAVYEAAARSVPLGIRQALHRRWAEVLQAEAGVPAARVARHWEGGVRWSEAGRAWHEAAMAARLSGQLAAQNELFERAARCHEQAGDRASRVESMLARLDGLLIQQGGAAVIAALPDVERLADASSQRLRCRIARTEALLVLGQADAALSEVSKSLDDLPRFPAHAVTVQAQHAMALARSGRLDEATRSASAAMAAVTTSGAGGDRLKAANALMFVHWSCGRIGDAVAAQREEFAAAIELGDQAIAAASEGSLATLLASAGDVRGTYEHASSARGRQRDFGLTDNSSPFILNTTVLGAAAAALGRFDEALESLEHAVTLAGDDAAPDVSAKARITLAMQWFTLGRPDRVRSALKVMPAQIPVGMQLQCCWLLARAAESEGHAADRHWARFDRWAAACVDQPFVMGVVFEASFRDPLAATLERLERAHAECTSLGLHGSARALQWRALARRLDHGDDAPASIDAAVAIARAIEPHVDGGIGAKCYVPEVLMDIARAYGRGGDATSQARCLEQARRWLAAALARTPSELRHAFATRNRVNRELLAASAAS